MLELLPSSLRLTAIYGLVIAASGEEDTDTKLRTATTANNCSDRLRGKCWSVGRHDGTHFCGPPLPGDPGFEFTDQIISITAVKPGS